MLIHFSEWKRQFIAINGSLGSPDEPSEYRSYSTYITQYEDMTGKCIILKRSANNDTQKKIVCNKNLLDQCASEC